MNKLLQHIINAGDVDHKILPSLLKMDEGGELIKLKDSKGRVREYNTESRKYKRLYDQGKIGSWSKFDQGSGKWVSSDASDPNAEFVSSPKILPEVVVSSKVKPNSLGSYSSSFYKENPYEDFYRNRYQQEKEEFESAPGWAQQSVGGWDRDSRQKNVRDQINEEYQKKYSDYVASKLIGRNPQGSQSRDTWLSNKNFTPRELQVLTGSQKLPQPNLWAQGVQGLYNTGDMLTFGSLPELAMPGIARSEVQNYNNPLLALAPLSVPAKMVQSVYKDNYSLGDALAGRPNDAGIAEDIATDPLTYLSFGTKPLLTGAARLSRLSSPYLNRAARFVPQAVKNNLQFLKNTKGTGVTQLPESGYVSGSYVPDYMKGVEVVDPETGVSKIVFQLEDDILPPPPTEQWNLIDYSNVPSFIDNLPGIVNKPSTLSVLKNKALASGTKLKNKLFPENYHDYGKPFANRRYDSWAHDIHPDLPDVLQPGELKNLHKEAIRHFGGRQGVSDLGQFANKNIGLYVRDRLANRIPSYTKPTVVDETTGLIKNYGPNKKHPSLAGKDAANEIIYPQLMYSHTYDQARLDILRTPYQKWGYDISKLNPSQLNLMDSYARGYNDFFNSYGRGFASPIKTKTGDFYADKVQQLKNAVVQNKFPEATQVRRGEGNYNINLLDPITYKPTGKVKLKSDLEVGDVYKDDGFLSTSLDRNYTWGEDVASEVIDIPGGMKQSYAYPNAMSSSPYVDELEAILPPGLIRRVEEVRLPNSDGRFLNNAKFRTSLINPYTTTGLFLGAGALKQKEEGGENKQYSGSSIVDYLATRGYSGNKKFRKQLAQEYGVEGYDYSARKNLELLSKLRENDDLLEAHEQSFAPVTPESLEELTKERTKRIVETATQRDERKISPQEFNRRMSMMMGFDVSQGIPSDRFVINTPKLSLSPKVKYDKFSLIPRMENKSIDLSSTKPDKPEVIQQVAPPVEKQPVVNNTGFRFDLNPTQKQGINPLPFYNPFIPGNMTVAGTNTPVAPATVNTSKPQQKQTVIDKPWYEDAWDAASSALNTAEDYASDAWQGISTAPAKVSKWWSDGINNSILGQGNVTMNPYGFTPQGAKAMADDLMSIMPEAVQDLWEKAKNSNERSKAKNNPSLVERKSGLDPTKLKYDPVYITGDTLKDNARRYHIPEVMDLDYMRFGVRNRGDYSELNTEGAPITTFEPFVSSKKYFATSKDPANATYIGISTDGRVKVGTKDKFQDKEYQITRSYGNKVIDFNRDETGKIVKVPSNPKASKETLSPSVKVLGDDGKAIDGKLSLLLPREGNQEQSYDLVTGGRYILQTPDGKTKLVSGSLKNIEDEFYRMKGKHPWVNIITLDNGSYSRGLRTFDQKLTKKDLKGYDNQNTGGGNFAYLLPGQKKTRYDSKFFDFEQEAKKKLQAKYPGRKVEIRFQNEGLYDETGGRDIESQINIQKKGNSKTPVSLHNFGAARDYILYVDGKPINADANKQLYKDVLWNAADATGTYHLEDWDPAHISLAKEGQKTAFDELAKKYPDIWANPNFQRSLEFINKNKANPTYEEYFEMLNNIAEFTGQPKVTEVMKRKGWKFNKDGKIVDKKGRLVNKASGGAVIDPRGQWAYPGMDTIVPTASGDITMQGVPYPVYGEDETGYGQMMMPGGEYQFPGQMVYETPMMKSGGQHGGLDRWFAERWVDVKTGKPCGRQEGENRAYPACRPSRRVSSQTPKTSSEMSPAEKAKFKRSKTSSQRINYNHKRN